MVEYTKEKRENQMLKIDWKNFVWSSDWDGEDVDYPNVPVVGLYRLKGTEIYFYIDIEENKVLEYWSDEDE